MRVGPLRILLCAATVVVAQHAERKFDVYGFLDATLAKKIIDDSHIMWTVGQDDHLAFEVTHVNVYGDWKPNPFMRSLIEVGLHAFPHGTGDSVGIITRSTVRILGYDTTTVSIDTIRAPKLPVDNTVFDNQDGPLEWGSITLERAWMDFLFENYVNLRVGKFITPYGIWNVDHGSPAILTVRQPYQTAHFRVFPRSQIGLMGYGTIYVGDTDLSYKLYASSGRNEISIEEATDVAVGGNMEAVLPVLDGLQLGFSGYTGLRRNQRGWRTIEMEVEMLPVIVPMYDSSGNFVGIDTAATQAATEQAIKDTLEVQGREFDRHTYGYESTSKAREVCLGMSAKLNVGALTLQGEYNYQHLANHMIPDAFTHVHAFYLLGAYRIPMHRHVSVTPYAMFEQITARGAHNNPQHLFEGTFFDGFLTVLGGVNIKVFTVGCVKLEYGLIKMQTIGEYTEYEDLYDIHLINTQFCMAF
ncbi:MAG: hypothetical protein GF331_03710 [Chitinivibrionales bacterium]|nr:hypothetical protein [Chitinivibrionales bacterium]